MTYYQFVQTVEQKVKMLAREQVCVRLYTAQRYNGAVRQGLLFSEQGSSLSPAIYLEEYYDKFTQGGDMEAIAAEILSLYGQIRSGRPWDTDILRDYAGIREKIVYRLINRERNRELLREMPYVPYLDLAVVFYVLFEAGRHGMATMPVKTEHLRQWGVTVEQAYQEAAKNTCLLLPCEFRTMSSVMAEFSEQEDDRKDGGEEDVLFVLSNRLRSFGAAAILYPGELERIGERLEENYYVLPSSVHEMLAVRGSAVLGQGSLSMMVAEINKTQVAKEEVLSDRAYYYDRARKELRL